MVVSRERRGRLLKVCVVTVLKRKDRGLFAYRLSWLVGKGGMRMEMTLSFILEEGYVFVVCFACAYFNMFRGCTCGGTCWEEFHF